MVHFILPKHGLFNKDVPNFYVSRLNKTVLQTINKFFQTIHLDAKLN